MSIIIFSNFTVSQFLIDGLFEFEIKSRWACLTLKLIIVTETSIASWMAKFCLWTDFFIFHWLNKTRWYTSFCIQVQIIRLAIAHTFRFCYVLIMWVGPWAIAAFTVSLTWLIKKDNFLYHFSTFLPPITKFHFKSNSPTRVRYRALNHSLLKRRNIRRISCIRSSIKCKRNCPIKTTGTLSVGWSSEHYLFMRWKVDNR